MGYFANGTEGMIYEEKYCSNCVHNENCAVLMLHHLHNYEECNKADSMLHVLIPRKDGRNQECTIRKSYGDLQMTGDVKRHKEKRGAPDYRGMFKDEVLAHEKTLRTLTSKQRNEVSLLTRIENLREENQELNKRDIVHINTECLQCVKQEKLQKEVERLAMYPAVCWALIAVIIMIIIGAVI